MSETKCTCGTTVTTPWCPTCGTDHRKNFPEKALVAHHTAAVTRTGNNLALAVAEKMEPGKKLDRIRANHNAARLLYTALAKILADAGRPIKELGRDDG